MLHNEKWWADVANVIATKNVGRAFKSKYDKIGSGAYSTAYALSDTVAMKITRNADPAAWTYLRWCQRNQGGEGIPTIYHLEKYSDQGGFVCVMKRYTSFKGGVCKLGDKLLRNGVDDTHFSTAISNVMREVDCFVDIHGGNIMMDGDKAVLIDPVASRE